MVPKEFFHLKKIKKKILINIINNIFDLYIFDVKYMMNTILKLIKLN